MLVAGLNSSFFFKYINHLKAHHSNHWNPVAQDFIDMMGQNCSLLKRHSKQGPFGIHRLLLLNGYYVPQQLDFRFFEKN